MVSSLNDEIDFRVSFDDSDYEDYMPTVQFILDDLDFFKEFKNEFPTIVYNDAQTSKSDLLTKLILSPQHIDEFDLNNETSVSEYDEEERNILYFNDLFPFNIIRLDDLKSEKDNDDNNIDIIQSSEDMAPLPPREQRHLFLRYQGLEYTDADIADFEERMVMEHRDVKADALGLHTEEEMESPGFARMMAHSIAGRSQAPEKVTVTDLFYLRRLDVGSICEQLDDTWAWVAMGPERQPDATDGAPRVAQDAPVIDEGGVGFQKFLQLSTATYTRECEFHDDNPPPPPPPVTPTQQAPHTLSTIKLPILKKVQVSTDTNGQIRVLPPKTAKEILARERERKARTTLLMSIPEDHLAKFHKMIDAKDMWEAIKSRFGGNNESKKMQKYILKQQFESFSVSNSEGLHKGYDRFQSLLSQLEIHGAGVSTEDANQKFLRSLPASWSQVSLIMRTKPGVDTLSFDDLYNNLRVFESDVKGSTASSSSTQNVAFVSSESTSSTNDVSTAYGVSTSSGHNSQKEGSSSYTDELKYSFFANQSSGPQLDHEDLEQVDEFDLEEMDLKWQVAMISMRLKKFYKNTGRKLQFDAKEPVGFDKTKVECFNCHNTRHFARECRSKRNQEGIRRDTGNTRYKAKYNGRRPGKQEEPKALVTLDEDGVDWTGHAEDEQENFTLMAYSNSGSNTEVTSCSKECEESYAKLKKLYDEQKEQLGDASIEIQAYTQALKKKLLAEAVKEKEELKIKLENFQSSSKGLSKLLNSQMRAKDKSGLGYGDQIREGILSYENEVLESVFDSMSSDVEDSHVYDRFVKVKGMHAVPPPMTGIYMPPKSDFGIDESNFTYGTKQSKTSEFAANTSDSVSCESNSSVETLESVPKPTVNEPKAVSKPKVWSDAPIIEEYESDNCDFHEKRMAKQVELNKLKGKATGQGENRPVWNNVQRLNYQNKFVPKADDQQKALKNKGIVDSGCSRHMTGNKAYLVEDQDYYGGSVAFGGSEGQITGKGKIITGKLDFENVYFVKELKQFNLFFVSQMCDKRNKVLFTDSECLVLSPDFKLPNENQVLLRVPRQNNMYSFNLENIVPTGGLACLIAKATVYESNKWHKRLGHVNFKVLNTLVKGNLVKGLPSKIFQNDHTCVACQKGKQHKASCKAKVVSSISHPLQLLHMDLFGPTSVRSINHKTYCLVITDDFSRFSWVFFLRTKDETTSILKDFIRQIKNQLNQNVKTIRCDNGTEFKNRDIIKFYGSKGIKREYSNARTPQQNGVAKRKNMILIEVARTMLADPFLPNTFEAVSTACYVLNRVLVAKPQNKIPYELITSKFEEKTDEGFLVGYSLNSKAFRPVTAENKANKTAGPKEANHSASTKDNIDVGNSKIEAEPAQEYFVLPLWSSYTSKVKGSEAKNRDEKPNGDTGPKTNEEPKDQAFLEELKRLKRQEKEANDAAKAFRNEFAQCTEDLLLQAGAARATSTNTVNTVSTPISTASPSRVFSAGGPDLTNNDQDDSQITVLEEIYDNPSNRIFTNASYDDKGAVADFTNLETTMNVSPIPTSRIHSIHPTTQILGDPTSTVQTRSKVNKSSRAHAFISYIQKQRRNNHKDFQHCLFACFLSQIEPKKISQALEDES
ncbi:putative ribonuclease H-like domain-containing protein [Tanacetum coccineum]